jgi:peptide-methionine (S)-S-oxide reductase
MDGVEIRDPLFREAVSAVAAGAVDTLESLLTAHPSLVRERLDGGDGYFSRPYLLWFVAENPVRNGTLPPNIVQVTGTILDAARRAGVSNLGEQVDYALSLVCSGRVARECGVQHALVDVLVEAGARPEPALVAALAHRELAAAEQLLRHGARTTLLAAVGTGRDGEALRLLPAASEEDRRLALAGAAFYGRAPVLERVIASGVDVDAYSPTEFHPHATALHHAVDSGSLGAVEALVRAGASLELRDRIHGGTPLEWADHLGRSEIAAYLRDQATRAPAAG